MHDPYFDHRLDPRPIPLLQSRATQVLGAVFLTVAAMAPIVLIAGLIGANA